MIRVAAISGCLLAGAVWAAPLAERSLPSGKTMFTRMPASSTGIVVPNPYDDPRMWSELYRELTFGAMGTGVAVGDFDNDGRPDVFVVSKTKTSRLFRNLGDWKFEDVTVAAGLAGAEAESGLLGGLFGGGDDDAALKDWEQGVTWADINNDGWLDLYVCRHAAPNLLWVNQGDGTFREEGEKRGLSIVDGSGVGAFADYDRDGDLDVYVQTNMMDYAKYPDGRPDYLLRNRGDGFFADVTAAAGIAGMTSGHSATWGDYDGDGWTDLYVANDFAPPDQLYRNNGDGTFTDVINAAVPSMPFYGMGADTADVDGDGTFDIFVADMAATSHEKDQRSMAGSRVRGQKHDEASAAPPAYMRNHLLLNTGKGQFREAAHLAGLAATDWTWSIRWEDFDHDGRVDLHVTNGMNREYHGADLLERIMISENPSEPIRIMQESPPLSEANLAFRNQGDLRFEPVGAKWGLAETGVSFGAATGDFDGDGDLDLIYANYEADPTVLRNDSTNGNRLVVELRGQHSNRFGVGAIVRIWAGDQPQVRELQPTRGYLSSGEPVVHFGLGEVTTIDHLEVRWPSGAQTTMENVGVNQRLQIEEPDLIAPDSSSQVRARFRNDAAKLNLQWPAPESAAAEESGQALLPFRFDRRGAQIAVGDYTGDGRADLVVGGTTAAPPRLLVAGAAGGFNQAEVPALAYPAGVPMGPVALFDADGDGRLDLLVTATGADTLRDPAIHLPRLFLNRQGFAAASAGALPSQPIRAGAVAVTDFDRDGDQDIFIGARLQPGEYPRSPQSQLLRNDGGRFTAVAAELGVADVGMVTAAHWTDTDGDGWDDLVVTNDWGGVRLLHNNQGRGFQEVTAESGFASAGKGWWRSLAVADFNADGRPDFVVGNVGLNTPYQATVDAPVEIYLGNFNGRRRGTSTLIEAYYEDGRLLPRRERKDLAREIRALGRKYRRTIDYAAADLPAMVGAENLDSAYRVSADQLQSGVVLSQPDGAWAFRPFPRIAQIAPAQVTLVFDFDDDGHADVLLLQNDHSPIELVGRFSGGLGQLLRGDGAGNFEPVGPEEGALQISGAVADAVLIDVDEDGDGDEEVFLTRVQGTSMLLDESAGYSATSVK